MKILGVILLAGILLSGCKTSKQGYTKKEQALPVPTLSESLQQKQLNSVDFYARGNVPSSWTLEMDFGNLIRFKSLDGTDVNSTAVQPVEIPDKKATSYTSKATNGNIVILIYEEACTDAISGEKYNKKVEVLVNNKHYEGCGQYLFEGALNGKWILDKINNRTLQSNQFAKGLPEITLQMANGLLSGHDGCNQISAGFEVLGSKIKFKSFVSTKMACPDNKPENEFSHLLNNQTVDYYFKEGQLYFYLPDDSIVLFKRG